MCISLFAYALYTNSFMCMYYNVLPNKLIHSHEMTVLFVLSGDLKLVEKPSPITMGPHDFTNIKASMKVASTENGIIFGNIG